MRLLIAVLLVLVAVGAEEDIDGRIAGGTRVGAREYPYLVGVWADMGNNHYKGCGASMLSRTRSVTAAHCWKYKNSQAKQFTLIFGAGNFFSGGTRVTATNVEVHPNYDMDAITYDIAMISHPSVEYTDTIQFISLPSGVLVNDNFAGTWATAVGFGSTSDAGPGTKNTDKYMVNLQVIRNDICAKSYGSSSIIPSTLCVDTTGGRSTCDGDSGGPLAIVNGGKPVLIGISSYSSDKGCQKGYPAVFTRVTSVVSWIRQKM